MKNIISALSICVFLCTIPLSSSAQFIKKLQKAASRGVERAVEDKVEEEANKYVRRQLEKQLAGLYSEDSESTPLNLDMNMMLAGLGEDVPTEESYSFIGSAKFEIQTTSKKGKKEDPMILTSFFAAGENYTGMEFIDPENAGLKTTIIFDMTHDASILLMDNEGEKSYFAYNLNMEAIVDGLDPEAAESLENSEFSIEKTGETKTILGYSCEEYRVKTKDGEGNYWVTDEPIEGYDSFWGRNSPFVSTKTQERYSDHFSNLPNGNFMEMNFLSNDGEEMKMKVLEINPDQPMNFVMADYPGIMQTMEK